MAQRSKPKEEELKVKLKLHSGNYNGVEIVKCCSDFSLVRWKNAKSNEDSVLGTVGREEPDFLLWMKTDELAVCCPSAHKKGNDGGLQAVSDECDDALTLRNDVHIWVTRLRNSVPLTRSGSHSAVCRSTALPSTLPLSHIIDILSAYAKVGFLVDTFKSTGGIDLFLELLYSNPAQLATEPQHAIELKKRVCMLLLSLSVVDTHINSYILSKLMKENSEAVLVLNQESGEVLLDLSLPMLQLIASEAFTCVTNKNLPQLPTSSSLCSMVKSFLRIDAKYYQQNKRLAISQHSDDQEYFNLLFNFCDEFIHLLESSRHHFSSASNENTEKPSIFNAIAAANKKEKSPVEKEKSSVTAKKPADFRSAEEYTKFLRCGRKVDSNFRSGVPYQGGAEEFTETSVEQPNTKLEKGSNSSEKYWNHIIVVEEDADFISKTVTKYQWWEVLGTLRKVPSQTDAVLSLMNVKNLKELAKLTPTIVEVIPLVLLLKPRIPLSNWEALTIVQEIFSQNRCLLETDEHPKVIESNHNISKVAAVLPVADTWEEEKGMLSTKMAEEIRKIEEKIKQRSSSSSYFITGVVKSIKPIIKKYSDNAQIALHIANCILLLAMKLKCNDDYAECCKSEIFNLILSLMSRDKTSCALQTTCIKAFYFLMGPVKDGVVSHTLPTIISTIISLASDNPKSNISLIVDGIKAIADFHNSEACSPKQKIATLESISCGLMILVTILDNGDFEELAKTYQRWNVAETICSVSSITINFKFKKELCFFLKYSTKKTSYHDDSGFAECLLEMLQYTQFLGQLPTTMMEDAHSVRSVRRFERRIANAERAMSTFGGLFFNFIIKCLSPLGVQKQKDGSYKLVAIPKSIWAVFVNFGGLLHLSNILTSTDTNNKTKKGCLLLLGCLVMDPEACPIIVIQNCLDAVIATMDLKPLEKDDLLDMCAQVFFHLSQSEEAMALMCTRTPPLSTVLNRFANNNRTLKNVQVLLARKEQEPEVLNRKQRNKDVFEKMFLIFSDLVITHVDDARRNNVMPSLPFIRKIFPTTLKSKAKNSFRKVEVSSSEDKVSNLTDGDLSTYWEPRTSTSNHWIDLQMKSGVIVKKLLVNFSDNYFDSAPTIVFTGTDQFGNSSVIKKTELTRPQSTTCTVAIEDLKKHYSSIKITIDCESYNRIKIRQITCESTLELNPFQSMFSSLLTQTQFYYNIQCHSWAYSAGSSQNNLLDIFDEVMASLFYEQKLADYLGLSYECQYILGIALKSSLIDYFFAIIMSEREQMASFLKTYLSYIAVSSTTRLHSIMMSLLHHQNGIEHSQSYILKNDKIQDGKFKETILLQSRVRRMCGFIADCFPKAQPNSAYSVLIDVWEDVARFSVLQFFKQLDFSSNPLSVMIEFVIFYQKIKQASREIFKDSPLYIIAATEGLSRAFLLLELTDTIKLCECICNAIDQMLRGFADLSESDLTILLSELADGLQCFVGLEAASIFELVYRKYLMRRTLNSCCQNLTMEMNVAKLFLQCFPNMYPLSMIENLKKSEAYLDEFKSSYIFKTFDEEIMFDCYQTSQDTASFEKMSIYKSVDFSATIISSNLWPTYSPIPMAALKLAPPLLVFVDDYNKYFSKEGKRLSWTQQGHAQIKCTYTTSIINVSTVQMLILMAFNDMKRIRFQQLVDTLGMSPAVISSALQPMVKCAKPLLIVSHEESNNTSCVYSINEELLSSNHKLSCKQYHENSEGTDDLRVISQRRRNIMRTRIVKFMKKEKQSTIHSVYSTIRGICITTDLFGRFECTYSDVQAEINDLVLSGYLKQLEENPHILLYTVEPYEGSCSNDMNWLDSPSKILEFKGAEYKDTPLSRLPNEEATLLSVSRNIESSIQYVAELLNIDSDIAEVMLLTYSWNVENLLNRCYADKKFISRYTKGSKAIEMDASNSCPICFSDETVHFVFLHCKHVSCTDCWYRYLQINLTSSPSGGTSHQWSCMKDNCFMKPTRRFVAKIVEGKPDADTIIAKYNELILQEFVKQCYWLGFCQNPKGCREVVSTNSNGFSGTCQLCKWSSCSSCNFVEDHSPASCDEVREWIEAGGFHGGMSNEAKSTYLANQIAKRCPECNMQIEKSAGCLHMTCKCGYHFCWKCLKSWADNHTDYYECKKEISKAMEKTKKFREQTQKCETIYASKQAAESMKPKIFKAIEGKNRLPVKLISLLPHAQLLLVKCYQVQFYLCIVEYFSKSSDVLHILQDRLVSMTSTLQTFLETVIFRISNKTLNSKSAVAANECVNNGHQLVHCVKAILKKVSFGAKEGFKLPCTFINEHDSAPYSTANDGTSSTAKDEVEMGDLLSRLQRAQRAVFSYRMDDHEDVMIRYASDNYDDDDDDYYDDYYDNDVDYFGYGSSD